MKFVNTASYDVKASGNVAHSSASFSGITPYQTGGKNYTGNIPYNDTSKNIFDLEGNVFAWTTLATGTSDRIYRGGSCFMKNSASNSGTYYSIGSGYADIGSISQLYIK